MNTTDPLTDAELDALDALNRARTPGLWRPGAVQRDRIFVPYADALEGPNGERVQRSGDGAGVVDVRGEVRASRAALRFGEHVKAHDTEGRYSRGWIVAMDEDGCVQLDIATESGTPSGRHSEWLANPERCPVYKPSTFRYFSTLADDGTGDVIDHYGRRPGP